MDRVAGAVGPTPLLAGLLAGRSDGDELAAALPDRVADIAEAWALVVHEPFTPGGVTSWVAPVTARDGTPAVLKLVVVEDETLAEPDALAAHDGDGAVRLLADDRLRRALLLERCRPGSPLDTLDDDDVIDIACALLRRLWRSDMDAGLFPVLGDVTAAWAALVRARFDRHGPPYDRGLVEHGAALLEALPRTAPRHVLLHVDFHPGNVLAAEREPWLTIDPKPMVGDPAFDVVQLLRHGEPTGRALAERLATLAARLDLGAERIAAWGVARNVEWAMWDLAHDSPERATQAMTRAAALAEL